VRFAAKQKPHRLSIAPTNGAQRRRGAHALGEGAQALTPPDREAATNDQSALSMNRDGRLTEVLDANLAAREASTSPDVEELLARHPDLAGDLRECLAFNRRAEAKKSRAQSS
jgi:hypothetical protein